MSETIAKLLAAIESLPGDEQHELFVAILRRTGEVDSVSVTDNELVGIADELFQALDVKESTWI